MIAISQKLNPETIREFPPCRTLSIERRRLGLSQTRLATVCLIAALEIDRAHQQELTAWVVEKGFACCGRLGEVTTISELESGRITASPEEQELIDRISAYLEVELNLPQLRESFLISQSRFSSLCIVANSLLADEMKCSIVRQIVLGRVRCPIAGDALQISQVECGARPLSSAAIKAFTRGFSLLWGREVTGEELFEDS